MSVYKRTIVSKGGKKSLYWYVEVSTPNGKKIKRSIGKVGEMTKAVAREVEQELKRKVKLGQWDMIQAEIPTFNDFIPDFISYLRDIKQNRAWKQAEDCVKGIALLFGGKKLSEIRSADIEDYKRIKIQEGKKPATIDKTLSFVRHLFNYAKRCDKFYANNPVSTAGLLPINNQKTRVLTLEEEDFLLANANEPLKSMIHIAIYSGLRLNSIRTLKWTHVDLNSNTITIEATYSKNKKTHVIPMNATVRKVLLEAKLRYGNSEYVLPEAADLSQTAISGRFMRLCIKLGLQGLRFHDLRHTCGTRLAEMGKDISTISKALGHSSINMSMRYVHPKESVKRAMDDLDNYRSFATSSTTSENKDYAK
ncbi:MAG: tyrosine-type recombinase/integrase [Ignavibacteriales bacterium]